MMLVDNDQIVRDNVFGYFIAPTKIINYVGDANDLNWINKASAFNYIPGFISESSDPDAYCWIWMTPKDQYEKTMASINDIVQSYLDWLNEGDDRNLIDEIQIASLVWFTNDSAIIAYVVSPANDESMEKEDYNDIPNLYTLNDPMDTEDFDIDSINKTIESNFPEDIRDWAFKEFGYILIE